MRILLIAAFSSAALCSWGQTTQTTPSKGTNNALETSNSQITSNYQYPKSIEIIDDKDVIDVEGTNDPTSSGFIKYADGYYGKQEGRITIVIETDKN